MTGDSVERCAHPGSSAWPRLLLPIALAGAALRVPRLFESLWYDELWTSHLFLGTKIRVFSTIFLESAHPPLNMLLMWAWTSIFGDSELALRAPPFLYGTASVFLTYRLALYYTNASAALICAALLAFAPTHIWYAAESGVYAANQFWLLLLALAFEKVREREGTSTWLWVYLVSAVAAAFSHYFLSLYLLVISVYCLAKRGRTLWRVLLINASCLAGLGCFVLLTFLFLPFEAGMGYLRELNLTELWLLFFNWYLFGNTLWGLSAYGVDLETLLSRPWLLAFQFTFFLVFLRGAWILVASPGPSRRSGQRLLIYLFLIPTFLITLGQLGFANSYLERSTFVALPFFLMVLSGGFVFSSRRATAAASALLFAVNLLAVVQLFKLSDQWTVYKPNPDWRSAALYFSEHFDGSDESAVIFAASPATTLLYYDGRVEDSVHAAKAQFYFMQMLNRLQGILGPDHVFVTTLYGRGHHWALADTKPESGALPIRYTPAGEKAIPFRRYDSFYFLVNHYWAGGPESQALERVRDAAARSPAFERVEERSFRGIGIEKFQRVQGVERKQTDGKVRGRRIETPDR